MMNLFLMSFLFVFPYYFFSSHSFFLKGWFSVSGLDRRERNTKKTHAPSERHSYKIITVSVHRASFIMRDRVSRVEIRYLNGKLKQKSSHIVKRWYPGPVINGVFFFFFWILLWDTTWVVEHDLIHHLKIETEAYISLGSGRRRSLNIKYFLKNGFGWSEPERLGPDEQTFH